MIHSIIKRMRTRNVNPPSWCTFDLDNLQEHVATAPYRWERTATGTIRGTLDKGFGRSYGIEWDEASRSLTFTDTLNSGFLFVTNSESSETTLSDMPPESIATVKAALANVGI